AHHLIRKRFQGNLLDLRANLRSLADLILEIDKHEALHDLDEDEQIRQIEAMRADIRKGNRIAEAQQQFIEESVAEWEARHPDDPSGEELGGTT
ncbi:MAG: hypothetical protein FWC87_15345, partial [Acidimicrobiaceae bacterium]|nr:hypothetical protein [Acidimicrobiaceae bacterium]